MVLKLVQSLLLGEGYINEHFTTGKNLLHVLQTAGMQNQYTASTQMKEALVICMGGYMAKIRRADL